MRTLVHVGSDGKAGLYDTHVLQHKAKLACSLAVSVLTSDMLRQAVADADEAQFHPRKIASLACDIAEALYTEFEKREWELAVPLPQGVEG